MGSQVSRKWIALFANTVKTPDTSTGIVRRPQPGNEITIGKYHVSESNTDKNRTSSAMILASRAMVVQVVLDHMPQAAAVEVGAHQET